MSKTGFAVLFFLVSAGLAAAGSGLPEKPSLEITAKLNKESFKIGDRIIYTIEAAARKKIDVKFPAFKGGLEGLALRDFSLDERRFLSKKILIKRYILDTYKVGTYTIPPVIVKWRMHGGKDWHDIRTNEIIVKVKSLLRDAPDIADIRDIKAPVEMRNAAAHVVIACLAAFVVTAGAALMLFRTRHKEGEIIISHRPAHIIAYEALDELNRRNLIEDGRIKEYYTEISGIIRHYLEDRFKLRAPEMTTEEFLVNAKDKRELSLGHRSILRNFLLQCDLVKFAEYSPVRSEICSVFESAKKLIDQTKPKDDKGPINDIA